MIDKMSAAHFLLSLDPNRDYFNTNAIKMNERVFWEGNARLNKMLHLAQNIYIGKYGEPLIDADFLAYDNGGVIPEIQENYRMLLATNTQEEIHLDSDAKAYLAIIFDIFKDAPVEELIEIDHEDPAWQEKHQYYNKLDQVMDPMSFVDDYRVRYADINELIDEMEM